jgi:hypothetical protein
MRIGVHTFGEARAQDTGNLLDKAVGGDKGIVLVGKLLDELLILVELLQVVGRHGVEAAVFGSINIELVTQDADGHVWAGNVRQFDGTAETFVTLGITAATLSVITYESESSCRVRILVL